MTENFFLDNVDLQFRLSRLNLQDVIALKEKGYAYCQQHQAAPRSYADAMDSYRLLLEGLGELCATVIAPRAAEADEEGAQYDGGEVHYAAATQAALSALKQADLMGVTLPWEYGGLNLPQSVYQMMIELIARAEAGLMTIFSLQEMALALAEYGDEAAKARLLPRFVRGEVAGAMVLTEPDAGSDLGSVQMRASLDEATGTWRLNGVKRFITNGQAEVQLVLARSEPGTTDARGLSLFLVERDESVRVRRLENKLGIHSSPTCELQYTDTPAVLIGKRRFGLIRYALALMNGARLTVSAQALGIAEAAYREARGYAEARVQFSEPVCEFPAVTRMLLSMRGEIEAARALVCETAGWVDLQKALEQHLADAPNPDPDVRRRLKLASGYADALTPLCKYYATEMGNRVCYQAMQIHGGVGYMREFNVERHYRDVRVTNIYEGTSQMQVVAALGKLLGHALDPLFDEWEQLKCGADLEALKAEWLAAVALLKNATEHLKSQDRRLIDYYASDLVDMAVYVINGGLLLKDAAALQGGQPQGGRRRAVAQVYLQEHLPQVRAAHAVILAGNAAPLEAKELIL
jgi:alkylation response protein AidB-like acyl-CoA dehydrogenase